MIPIHEIPEIDELRSKVAEMGAPFEPEQLYVFLHFLRTSGIVLRALEDFFGQHDLSLSRFSVLALLYFRYQEGLTPSELAAKRGVSKATLTPVLDYLEREKLIVRLKDPDDRRRQVIRLTTHGFSKMERMVPDYESFLNRVIGKLGLREIEQFLPFLRKLEAFGERPGSSPVPAKRRHSNPD